MAQEKSQKLKPNNTTDTIDSTTVFIELTNERYRVLEAKVNKNADQIESLDDKVDTRFDQMQRDVFELKTEQRTDSARNQQSTRNAIIGAAATIIGTLLAAVVTLIIILPNLPTSVI